MGHSRGNKYHNVKIHYGDDVFDSKHEFERWQELRLMERAGKIVNLQRQVKFCIIPSQRIDGKVVERPCYYIADFAYYTPQGEYIVEDSKGHRTPEYIIKRKLMMWAHGIRIKET